MTMRFLAPILILAFTPAAAFAQPVADPADNEKINQVIVYGDQPCPKGAADEIVICERRADPYRIPKPLRSNPNAPENAAWGARAESLEYVGRTGIGSCTPTGSGGASGCFNQLVRQARAERAQGDGTNWVALVEEAREARVGRIDADSDAIEARVKAEEAAKAARDAEAAKAPK
jgi:hypothetical protein